MAQINYWFDSGIKHRIHGELYSFLQMSEAPLSDSSVVVPVDDDFGFAVRCFPVAATYNRR